MIINYAQDQIESFILCTLAYCKSFLTINKDDIYTKFMYIDIFDSRQSFDDAIEDLLNNDQIEYANKQRTTETTLEITNLYVLTALKDLYTQHIDDWLPAIKKAFPLNSHLNLRYNEAFQLFLYITNHWDQSVKGTKQNYFRMAENILLPVFDDPDYQWLFNDLLTNERHFYQFTESFLRFCLSYNISTNWLYLKDWSSERENRNLTSPGPYGIVPYPIRKDYFDQFRFWHYLATGLDKAEQPDSYYNLLSLAIQKIYASQYAGAIELFHKALTTKYKEYNTSAETFFLFVVQYYYMMALLLDGSDSSIETLNQLSTKSSLKDGRLFEYGLVKPIQKQLYNTFYEIPNELLEDSSKDYLQRWFGQYSINLSYNLWALTNGYKKAIFKQSLWKFARLECHNCEDVTPEELSDLENLFGGKALCDRLHISKPWENIIDQIMNMDSSSANSSAQLETERIAYMLQGNIFETYLQKRKKNGDWGIGKKIPPYTLQESKYSCLDELDTKIGRMVKYLDLQLSGSKFFAALAGCSRVVRRKNQYSITQLPVNIEKETPYLVINKIEDGSFIVDSNVNTDELNLTKDGYIVKRYSAVHYGVISLSAEEMKLYKLLLNADSFPAEAEPALKQAIEVISNKTDLFSDTLEVNSSIEKVSADSRIVLRFINNEKSGKGKKDLCWSLKPGVTPSPLSPEFYSPCTGRSILLVKDANENRLQVNRSFDEENKNVEKVKKLFSNLGIISHSVPWKNINYYDFTINQILAIMDWAQANGNVAVVEFKSDSNVNLMKKEISAKQVRLQLKPQSNWFDIEGEVKIDEKHVLSLQQLLEMMATGNYIRLDESNYIKISNELRQQMQMLSNMSNTRQGKRIMSNASAGLLHNMIDQDMIDQDENAELMSLLNRIKQSSDETPEIPKDLNASMRDYQREGYNWITRTTAWGAGVCLADDMGLGKTLQSIAFILSKSQDGPTLIIAPTSVVPNWRNELTKFAPTLHLSVLNDADAKVRSKVINEAKAGDVVLSSYGIMVQAEQTIAQKLWTTVCLDEAHTIKNRDTKMSQTAMKLQAQHRIILTGTPIQNHLSELWNLMEFINPGMFGSFDSFQKKFILPIEQNKDTEIQDLLRRMISPFLLRRTKQEVLNELPEKEEITLPIELSATEMTFYEANRRKAESLLADSENVDVSVLAEITRLRQIACSCALVEKDWKEGSSKIDALIGLLQEILPGDNRVLVFSQFTGFLANVCNALKENGMDYLYLDGSTPIKKREQLVEQFQKGKCPLFLISLKAGGLGLNLTHANYVIHLDPWWNPAIEQQATDRAYRIGQKNNVTVYHLIAQHTIEEKIIRLHQTKRDLADSLLEGSNMSHKLSKEDLMELLCTQK